MNSYSYGAQSPKQVRDLLGPVRQVGYIVDDIEAAALDWVTRFGIGPWRVKTSVVFDSCTYRGVAIDVDIAIATATSDGLEIELIAPKGGPASMYSDAGQPSRSPRSENTSHNGTQRMGSASRPPHAPSPES